MYQREYPPEAQEKIMVGVVVVFVITATGVQTLSEASR
jgi:hypothetical protein